MAHRMVEHCMKHQSGEEIRKADKVLLHGEPGEIEFVIETGVNHPQVDWYMKEYGPGVMVHEPKIFGRVYLCDTEGMEDLVLASREPID